MLVSGGCEFWCRIFNLINCKAVEWRIFEKEEGSNEWHHTRDEDLFQWRIILLEWNRRSGIVRSEKMKAKEKKERRFVSGNRDGLKSGK